MPRFVIAVVLATLASPVALAQDAKADACILTATETIKAPKKPREFTLRLDCGSEPTTDQQTAAAVVASKANIADGLQFALGLGYEIEGASTINSFTGNAIYTYYTLVRGAGFVAGAAKPATDELDELEDADEPAEVPVTPPADPAATPATPAP